MLGEQELRLLKDFANGGPAGPMEGTLHGRLQQQAARVPERPAVVDGARVLSMRELDRKANGLALRLRGLGAGPGSPVGLLLERSAEMLVSVFGILKAGSAYLPIDPDYPSERVALMLGDGRPPVVITQRSLRERLAGYEGQVLCLDEGESPLREEDAAPAVAVGPGIWLMSSIPRAPRESPRAWPCTMAPCSTCSRRCARRCTGRLSLRDHSTWR